VAGRTEWDQFPATRDAEGEHVSTGRYRVVDVSRAWELYSMLGVTVPSVQDHYEQSSDGRRTT
jgi:hypothetical protein